MTITTTGPNSGIGPSRPNLRLQSRHRSPWLPLTLPIAGVVMVGFVGRKVSRYSVGLGLCVSLVLLGFMVACGGSSGPPVATVSPQNAQVGLGKTQQFTSNLSVTWSLSGVGTLSSGGLYTAPSTGTTPINNIVVTGTPSSGNPGQSTITIPAVGVTVSPGTPAVNMYAAEAGNAWPASATQQQFTGTVTNAANTAVTWTALSPADGAIDPNTGLYTAPATVPNPASFTVTATSVADPSKSQTGTVNILTPTALGNFPVTVTATEGAISHSQGITLIVQ
jgi:hypothetical protein